MSITQKCIFYEMHNCVLIDFKINKLFPQCCTVAVYLYVTMSHSFPVLLGMAADVHFG